MLSNVSEEDKNVTLLPGMCRGRQKKLVLAVSGTV
jgi:hypothetical protein